MWSFVCFLLFAIPDILVQMSLCWEASEKFFVAGRCALKSWSRCFYHDLDDRRFRGEVGGIIWSFYLPNGCFRLCVMSPRGISMCAQARDDDMKKGTKLVFRRRWRYDEGFDVDL